MSASALQVAIPLALLGALIFIGRSASGTLPLIMGTIPSETMPARYLATSLGLAMGLNEAPAAPRRQRRSPPEG
jgi:hypothetical protein